MKIVVVEDDSWFAAQFRRTLEAANFTVSTVANAEMAIDAIDDTHPDVIVLDMLLRGSNALGLLHELQSHSDLAQIPIIVVTSLADSMSEQSLRHYGVRAVLDKTTMLPDDVVHEITKVTTHG